MTTAEIKEKILNDTVFLGLRLAIGVIFILHGYSKFGNEGFVGWISSMGGAIFHVKGAQSITGDKGIEFDLILLAVALVIIVAGPGRISLSQIIKKIPRCLH